MLKLLWRFGLLLVLAIAFAWLADRPGRVTVHWLGRDIETSVVVAVALALALIGSLLFAWSMLRQVWRSPKAAQEFWRFRKHRKGYEALSKGIIAAGAGDAQSAARHAATAGNALSDEPLVNVLAAQAAQLKGDKANVKKIFEAMANSPETELLGLRGLFSEARGSGDLVDALRHAEKALANNPRLPWASQAVLQVQTARKQWEAAALTLDQQGRSGLLDKKQANRKRAALLAAEALNLESDNKDKALKLAEQALDLDQGLVPAACVVARRHIANESVRRANKVLRNTWAISPHPELADLMSRVQTGEGPEARYERVRDGVGETDGNLEAAVALARAALLAQRFDVARKALQPHSEDRPQARVCALMAQLEDAAGDKGRAREWLARALHAPRDPMWMSDGVAHTRWVPVSPVTGEIVPCEWKAPFDMLPPTDEPGLFAAYPSAVLLGNAAAKNADSTPTTKPRLPDDPGIGAADEN